MLEAGRRGHLSQHLRDRRVIDEDDAIGAVAAAKSASSVRTTCASRVSNSVRSIPDPRTESAQPSRGSVKAS